MKAKPVIIAVAALVAVLGGYFWYRAAHPPVVTQYVMGAVTRGTISTTVNGTGQVSASDQIDVKPKASGTLLSLKVQEGQVVKAGDLIGNIDATSALKAVRDAQASLDSAKLSLQKLQQPADALTLVQAQNALASAQATRAKADDDLAKANADAVSANDNLTKAYADGYTEVTNSFLDLPGVMQGLNDLLYTSTIDKYGGRWNIDYYADAIAKYDDMSPQEKAVVTDAFNKAKASYDATFAAYKATPSTADQATIDGLITQTQATVSLMTDAVKDASNFINHYVDEFTSHGITPNTASADHLATLGGFTKTLGGHASALLGATTSIKNARTAITNAQYAIKNAQAAIVSDDQSIAEKQASLAKIQAGADAIDLQSEQLAIVQRQNALLDAQQALANYTIRAPFDGVVAKVGAQVHDEVSSGTAVVTIVSNRKFAQISLNEVDAAKIKVGQKSALTFDAIDGLDITGHVATIDPLGAVSQGVVTYGVKIIFDVQDDRIKPGMSVSADVITDVHPDVLTVPNAAVKGVTGAQYVETIEGVDPNIGATPVSAPNGLKRITVTTGLANDTDTEILSGLNEGDLVVVRTVTNAKTSATAAPSILGGFGGRGGAAAGGGNVRFGGAGAVRGQ